jgi:hypothetical protein
MPINNKIYEKNLAGILKCKVSFIPQIYPAERKRKDTKKG